MAVTDHRHDVAGDVCVVERIHHVPRVDSHVLDADGPSPWVTPLTHMRWIAMADLDRWQYLLLMGACLALTLPLEWVLRARVYRRPLRALQAILVTVVVFSIWDIIAIGRGLWHYSPLYTTGIMLPFGFPLEELVFFIVIPLCALLTYEAVGYGLDVLTGLRRRRRTREDEDA